MKMKHPLPLFAFALTALLTCSVSAQPNGGPTKPDYPMNKEPIGSSLGQRWREPLPRKELSEHEESTVRTKFSDPAKPGTLKISLPWADVKVLGTEGNEIVVTSSLDQKGKKEVDEEGFRRLDEDVSFEVVEKNNVASIVMSGDNPWAAQGAEFTIQVPRNTNLILRTEAGGDVRVERINGDIDINSMNGEIALLDIGASAVVNTMNGEVTAIFKQAPTKPVSITSMNGEVDVRLPADTKANLRLRSHNGSIRTNFPEGALVTKTEKNAGTREHARAAEQMAREQARAMAQLSREQARLARAAAGEAAAPEAPEAAATPEPAAAPEAPAAPKEKTQVRAQVDVDVAVGDAKRHAEIALADAARALANAPFPGRGNFIGKSITGTLNGGGVDIQLSTMNGTITLRQVK